MKFKVSLTFILWGLVVLFGVVLVSQPATTARAQGGDEYPANVDPDEVYKVAREMYCDVCQGVPLSDCPSAQCQAWREEIADLLSQGYEKQEIKTIFAQRYGEKISGTPISDGNRLFVYGVSAVLLGLLGVLVGWQMLRWQHQKPTQLLAVANTAGTLAGFDRPVPDNVDPDYLDRFLELLKDKPA